MHAPGEALLVDWGKVASIVDPKSGGKRIVWALLGGVPVKLTSDNPTCFSLTACRYEPLFNGLYPVGV